MALEGDEVSFPKSLPMIWVKANLFFHLIYEKNELKSRSLGPLVSKGPFLLDSLWQNTLMKDIKYLENNQLL